MKPRKPQTAFCALALAACVLASVSQAQQPATTFRKHTLAIGYPFASVVIGDFDKDGKKDVATAATEEVAWFAGGARNILWRKFPIAAQTPETGTLTCNELSTADVDDDGDIDLISHTGGTGHLVWFENPGTREGTWKRRLIDVLKSPHGTAVEDINRDGHPEIVAAQEGSIVWYSIPRKPAEALPGNTANPGARTRWEQHSLATSGADGILHHLAFFDLNGDGRRDLCSAASSGNYLAWWEQPADPTLIWTRHLVKEVPGCAHLLPYDLNRDGKVDLVYAAGHKKGVYWLAGPDFKTEKPIDEDWLDNPHSPALEDLDGDGDIDFACAGRLNNRVGWWENDGKGAFTRHELDTEQAGLDLRIVDLDVDGDMDLVLAGENTKNLVWYENLRR